MKTLAYLDYCALPRYQQFFYKIYEFILKVIYGVWHFIKGIGIGTKKLVFRIGTSFKKMYHSFRYGDIFTKCSFFVLGISHIKRKQIVKGIILMLLEFAFIFFMIFFGAHALYKLVFVGTYGSGYICDGFDQVFETINGAWEFCDEPTKIAPDNSPKNLLYGILTILIIIGFICVYIATVNASYQIQTNEEEGKHIKSFKEDLADFFNSKFHITLLFLPIIGILLFNILPILDMICMAFTNYDYTTDFPKSYFSWVGLKNFGQLFSFGGNGFGYTFVEILKWTIVWAILATFTNFFIGIIIATIINRKGIKFKKFWRTCLVLSVAVPQFVSLLAMAQFLSDYGPLTVFIEKATGVKIYFLGKATTFTLFGHPFKVDFARILVVLINIWIGVPYTVLSTTGILMNVPEDLYESAKIDGASPITMYFKITLKYVVFVMGPSLITTFIGNFNSFGVIFLLTGGGPKTNNFYGSAGHTDLLVTWLYNLTMDTNPDYKMASVIGILIFLISSIISLILYRNSNSFKNEEDFA
ncbi:MAG: sugar ABC transporter permease [Bacilli bacterium]|nr:sugar ABC transporter permease [Bacillales bacterium]MDY2574500.1 sugar ABC transporter permease [Bacilli bacterium]